MQGCEIHCENCFNKETWDFDGGNEFTEKTIEEVLELCSKDFITGLSILGGEPLHPNNIEGTTKLAKAFKEKYPNMKEIVDTIKLDNENEWKHTWMDLPKSDSYTVRVINVPKGWTVTYQKEDNSFIVTNTSTLVQTGQMLWIVLLIGMIGVIFIIASLVYDKVLHEQNS